MDATQRLLWIEQLQLRYRRYLKPYVGESLRRAVSRGIYSLLLWRTRPLATRLLGPEHRRSRELVEIDITYVCNLKCFNCNRSCEQSPTTDKMSVAQVRRFLDESRDRGIRWKRIRVLGGEPTIHPQFFEIMNLILEYRDRYSPDTAVQLTTNGHGRRVNWVLDRMPPGVEVTNNLKSGQVQEDFASFNVAPVDRPEYRKSDFRNACPITSGCGIGVTPYGYYPCTVAGAIDRTFGFDMGRKELPADGDDMVEELRKFCSLCGHFKRSQEPPLDIPVMSPTWKKAYERANLSPPAMSAMPQSESPPDIPVEPSR